MVDGPKRDLVARASWRAPGLPASAFLTGYGLILRPIHAVGWRRIRLGAYAVYLALIAYGLVRYGVPTGRTTLALIIITGLCLTSVGHGWRRVGRVMIDWLPFTAVLVLYDRTRGVADTLDIDLHEKDILDAERWLLTRDERWGRERSARFGVSAPIGGEAQRVTSRADVDIAAEPASLR